MAGIADVATNLSKEFGVTRTVAEDIVKYVLGTIADLAATGSSVTVRGFGTFKEKTTAARTARNPQTGEPIQVPERTKLTFKAAK